MESFVKMNDKELCVSAELEFVPYFTLAQSHSHFG